MEEMIVTTLENAIYMSYKNDVSFLVYDQLALYEHQSTWNPNMPLRNLFYVSNIYSKLTKDTNLYGSRLKMCIRDRRYVNMAKRFFHEKEADYVQEKAPYQRFFRVWAAKESYVKYTGKGIDEMCIRDRCGARC